MLSAGGFTQTRIFPAAFEKQKGVCIVWTYSIAQDSILANISGAVQDFAPVWILYNPEITSFDTNSIRSFLLSRGVLEHNVSFVPAWTDTFWINDFGPISGYRNQGNEMIPFFLNADYSTYNQPNNDSIPQQLGNFWSVPVVNLPLALEGGNVLLDGSGVGFGSSWILEQNSSLTPSIVKSIIKSNFGLNDFHFIELPENCGGGPRKHLSMFMNIIDNQTILLSEYPEYLSYHTSFDNIAQQLSQLQNGLGVNYQVTRITAPPKENGLYAGSLEDEMRTYTNALILNGLVLVPSYQHPFDTSAKRIYQDLMPGYEVQLIDSRTLTPLHGAVKRLTKEITRDNFLRIKHSKVTGLQPYEPAPYIRCVVQGNIIADSQFVYYRKHYQSEFNRVPMFSACPYTVGQIPDLLPGDTVWYYLSVQSEYEEITEPSIGEAGAHKFWTEQNVSVQNNPDFQKANIIPDYGNSLIHIQTKDIKNSCTVKIIDLSGRVVFKGEYNTSRISIQMPLARSWYIINVYNTEINLNRKIFIH